MTHRGPGAAGRERQKILHIPDTAIATAVGVSSVYDHEPDAGYFYKENILKPRNWYFLKENYWQHITGIQIVLCP